MSEYKLKKLRLRNPDGSLSEMYDIGADAANIDVENKMTLDVKLNNMDVKINANKEAAGAASKMAGENKTSIDNMSEQVAAAQKDITDLDAIVKTKPYVFNTVADMKKCLTLKDGDACETLGYYEVNDGGNATYKIVNIKSDTEYQEDLGNGLYATLIIENEINVLQIGLFKDGIKDNSLLFNSFVNKINKNLTLLFPSGNYIFKNKISFNDTISLKGINGVPYLIFTGTGEFIKIIGHNNDNIYEKGTVNANADKKAILKNLCITTDSNEYFGKPNTIGLSFNTENDLHISRSLFYNVRITKFEKGILFPNRHFYINTFDNMSICNNKYGIVNEYNDGYVDSGERISFINSVIDANSSAFYFNNLKYDINIDNCSLDYNSCLFNAQIENRNSGGKISVTNCHYETNFPENIQDNFPHGIIYGAFPNSAIIFENNMIWTNLKEKQFINNLNISCNIFLTNNCYWFITGDYNTIDINNLFIANDYNVIAYGNLLGVESMALPFSVQQIVNEVPGFTYINATGTATIGEFNNLTDKGNRKTGWRIYNPLNISSYEILGDYDSTNKIYKPLRIYNNGNNAISFMINQREFTKLDKNKNTYITISGKNIFSIKYIVHYYDKDENVIASDSEYTLLDNNSINDKTLIIPHSIAYYPHLKSRPNEVKFDIDFKIVGIQGKNVDINAICFYHS